MHFIIREGTIIRNEGAGTAELEAGTELPVHEEFWFAHGNLPFFEAHLQRVEELLGFFGQPWPDDLPPGHEIKRLFLRLVNKNKAFMGGWVKAEFRFSPVKTRLNAMVVPHPERQFPLDPEGRTGFISPFVKFSRDPLARFPLASKPLRDLEQFRRETLSGAIPLFLNEKGVLTEAACAALYCIRKNTLLTPAPSTGCLRTLYHDYLLRAASQTGFQTTETDQLTPSDLAGCEEVFTLSEGEGFRWLSGIGDKRFVRTKTNLIGKQFNRSTFPLQG